MCVDPALLAAIETLLTPIPTGSRDSYEQARSRRNSQLIAYLREKAGLVGLFLFELVHAPFDGLTHAPVESRESGSVHVPVGSYPDDKRELQPLSHGKEPSLESVPVDAHLLGELAEGDDVKRLGCHRVRIAGLGLPSMRSCQAAVQAVTREA